LERRIEGVTDDESGQSMEEVPLIGQFGRGESDVEGRQRSIRKLLLQMKLKNIHITVSTIVQQIVN